MKKRLPKSDKTDAAELQEIKNLIAEYRAKETARQFEYPKRTYNEVRSWREAWVFIFYLAHLAHEDFLKSEDGKVKCVVWPVREFNDKLIGVLEKIAERIGSNHDLTEIRLIETGVTSAGIEKLKNFLPNATVKLFSREQARKDKRIEYVNTDIDWIKQLHL